ncbi:MAG: hypothetical protein UR60_C0042G0004 [Candidatus Moranbacteria bacterium GW2011_GWF2_34_56]|nr:MAG: hypothetical protein UR60_C0042G0004 [Candidatus Moranbacteria bacterium GW2011_GWF2_34_56]
MQISNSQETSYKQIKNYNFQTDNFFDVFNLMFRIPAY